MKFGAADAAPMLAERRGGGVVVHDHPHPQGVGDHVAQREVVPALELSGSSSRPAAQVERAGRADAGAEDLVGARRRLGDLARHEPGQRATTCSGGSSSAIALAARPPISPARSTSATAKPGAPSWIPIA